MAEDVLVKEFLSDSMIKAGAELTRILIQDEMKWLVTASMWFYFPEENRWKLLFSSSSVGKEGPKHAYQHIQEAIGRLPQDIPKVNLKDISVMDNSHPLISLMKIAIRTGEGISGIRFSRNAINGQLIEDAYIYRLL